LPLWLFKYVVGVTFLVCHLLVAGIIWIKMTPVPLIEDQASTLFYIILPMLSFYAVSFVKDMAKNQLADKFYDRQRLALPPAFVQLAVVVIFSLSLMWLLLDYQVAPYGFEALKMRFGILDAVFTGLVGAVSENLFGTIVRPATAVTDTTSDSAGRSGG
jgi:hypothetical protein